MNTNDFEYDIWEKDVNLIENIYISITKNSRMHNSCWIGSGLAKIPASYGCDLCNLHGINSFFYSALQYRNIKHSNLIPFLVTLAGKGNDAINTAKNMLLKSKQCGIITCSDSSECLNLLKNSLSYQVIGKFPELDNLRFVNIKGIITLSALVETFLEDELNIKRSKIDYKRIYNKANNALSNIRKKIKSICDVELIIIGEGYNTSIQYTWESILAESGVKMPIWKDIKDFTHGDVRYNSLNKNCVMLILETSDNKEYTDILYSRFKDIFITELLYLGKEYTEIFWSNLFFVIFITHMLSISLGYKGERPPRDPIVHSWREWGNLSL